MVFEAGKTVQVGADEMLHEGVADPFEGVVRVVGLAFVFEVVGRAFGEELEEVGVCDFWERAVCRLAGGHADNDRITTR